MRLNHSILALAAALLVGVVAAPAADEKKAQVAFQAAVARETIQGDLKGAIELFHTVVAEAGSNRSLAAQALVRIAECYQKLGDVQARSTLERIVREFADQPDAVNVARTRLRALESPRGMAGTTVARQVWSGAGVDTMGQPSPDGRYLSFTDWDTGDLAIRDLASGSSRRVTDTKGWVASGDYAGESVFSPDGQQIAYAWFVDKGPAGAPANGARFSNQLRVIPAAGGHARVVIDGGREYVRPFAWSPDGRAVYVERSTVGSSQIGRVQIADGAYRSIKSLEWRSPTRLALSPDGRFIAYDVPSAESRTPRDIVVLASDGSGETAVVAEPSDDVAPSWTPDGHHLLFLSDRTGATALWSVAIDGGRAAGAPILAKADVGPITPLGITRHGSLVYGLAGRSRQNIYAVETTAASPQQPRLAIGTFVNANTGPAWSPDGRFFAYYSFRKSVTAAPVLVVRTETDGSERTVALPADWFAPFNHSPRWFPDGRSVLIGSRDPQSGRGAFHRLSIETGEATLLHRVGRNMSSFDLSRDGKTIVWAHQTDGETLGNGRLLKFDLESRRETELAAGQWFITVAVSPDGRQVAYLKSIRQTREESPSTIDVMSIDGGPARELVRDRIWIGGSRYNAMTWSSDGQHFYFARERGRGNALFRVPVAGGDPSEVLVMPARIKAPAMHPEGRLLYFAAIEADNNEIWTLENFLKP